MAKEKLEKIEKWRKNSDFIVLSFIALITVLDGGFKMALFVMRSAVGTEIQKGNHKRRIWRAISAELSNEAFIDQSEAVRYGTQTEEE